MGRPLVANCKGFAEDEEDERAHDEQVGADDAAGCGGS